MLTQKDRLALPVPKAVRTRPRDHRGFRVPFIVMWDKAGTPIFTVNDARRVSECLTKRLCAICGKRMTDGYWFVGGSRCFLHPHGAFIDPPSHLDCAEYALKVCPFLAAPSYSKRIDDRKLTPENRPDDMALVRVEYMNPMQPERFGLGHCDNYRVVQRGPGDAVLVVERWNYVEWWKDGETVDAPDSPTGPADQELERFS